MTSRRQQPRPVPSPVPLRATPTFRPIILGAVLSLSLLGSWGLGLLVQASSTSGPTAPASLAPASTPSAQPPDATVKSVAAGIDPLAPPPNPDTSAKPAGAAASESGKGAVQGPAIDIPQEILAMLDLRKRDLDRREDALRTSEERLTLLKAELEQILTKYEKMVEAAEKRRKDAKDKQDKTATERKTKDEQNAADTRNLHQAQLIKIFESMPAEEAAARLEKMPDRKAVEVLRLLKGKTAGAILSAVRVERAARLTEQLLAAP